jgi:hypothetical protein
MSRATIAASPGSKARIAGALYLVIMIAGAFGELRVRERLTVSGNAAATAQNILAHELLYRAGFAGEVLMLAVNVPLLVIFYDLFQPVSRSAARLLAAFGLTGTAIQGAIMLNHYTPLVVLNSGGAFGAFSSEQSEALAFLSLRLHGAGYSIALVFFGCYCLATGYAVFRSTFLPRAIGVLMTVAGVCYLTNSFAIFLSPALADRLFPYILMPCGIGEGSLTLWLLLMGVNTAKWEARAGRAVAPIPT